MMANINADLNYPLTGDRLLHQQRREETFTELIIMTAFLIPLLFRYKRQFFFSLFDFFLNLFSSFV